jgi:carboxyl-terminal processing protease
MKRTIAALALLLVACKDSPTASAGGSAGATYANAVVDIMQANSIRRKTIDWSSLRTQVLATVPPGASIGDSYSAIYLALELLGDNHSTFRAPSGFELQASTLDCTAPTIAGMPALGSDIGYVRVGGDPGVGAVLQAYTDTVQAAIRAADNAQIRGWIVDLRGNSGGTLLPMIAAIGPILGTGTAGYLVDADGVKTPFAYDVSGTATYTTQKYSATSPYTLMSPSPRVAVLLDRRVASVGEATAIAFKQRPNTRFFGTETCGLSTYETGHVLSDQALLIIADRIDADRGSTVYGGTVLPDTVITDTSAVVPAAVAWLRGSSASTTRGHVHN